MKSDMVFPPRNGLSLCAGGGGLDMGLMLAEPDYHTRCYVEWEEYPRSTLVAAMRNGYFAPAPIWNDVTTFDAKPFSGAIDTVLAGYPCQPFSQAGQRKGASDERHLWPDIARIIDELGPSLRWCFFENVAGHLSLGLDTVLNDLRELGFSPAVGVFSAEEVGATHERQRVFIVAYRKGADGRGEQQAGAERGGRPGPARGRSELANADGGDACAEWQCGGGQQRFQQAGDRTSAAALVHAERTQWRPNFAERDNEDRGDARWHQTAGGFRQSGGAMADARRTRRQGGQQHGSYDEWRQKKSYRSTPELCHPLLFPPGPAEYDAWAEILGGPSGYLAPALAADNLATWARDSQTGHHSGVSKAPLEPAFCRVVDGMATRSRALRLLGNGVVPLAAAYAWRSLSAAHGLRWVDLEAAGADRC